MNRDGTSLDQLHDVVLPPDIAWWPPAPGWYVVIALILVIAGLLGWTVWKRWQADAYRRAALRRLSSAADAAAIGELLRRTALAIAPRPSIAEKTGDAWPGFLNAHCPAPMPSAVRTQLIDGIYRGEATPEDLGALRAYAATWIKTHRPPAVRDRELPC